MDDYINIPASGEDTFSFFEQTNLLAEFIKWGFLALLAAAIIVPICLRFYKGKNRTVEIVKLRRTVRDLFYPRLNAANNSSYIEHVNYTVDVKYKGGRHLHTFSCSEEVYNTLKEGKVYDVHIRLGEVKSIRD